MFYRIWPLLLCLLFILSCVILDTEAQKNKKRPSNGLKPGRWKPKPTQKPPAGRGGRWIPASQRRLLEAKRQQKATENKNKPRKNNLPNRGNLRFDNLIQPPLRRSPNEADLQEPSWSHCINNIQIDQNWASISSPNFPGPIKGQLQCTWLFEGLRGMRLQLSFNVVDLQAGSGGRCGNQFIDLIDMELLKSQGRFCGDRVPGDYVSVGRKIRLDIQGDTTLTPHTGFQAAVRSVQQAMQPGLRQRSTMFHGTSSTLAVTARPSVPRRMLPPKQKTKTKSTLAPTTIIAVHVRQGQIIYGLDNQPPAKAEIKTPTKKTINTTVILYSFIGVFCFLVLLSGIACIFRKQLYAKYKKYKKERKKRQNEKEEKKKEKTMELQNKRETKIEKGSDNPVFSRTELQLPESRVSTPSLDGRRRRSVVFEDEVLAGVVREPVRRNEETNLSAKTDIGSGRVKSQDNVPSLPDDTSKTNKFQGWNYPNGEPIYEDGTYSVASSSSARSTNRHSDHSSLKQQKLKEINEPFTRGNEIYAPLSEPIYHMGQPPAMPMHPNMRPPFFPGFMPPFYDPRNMYPVHPQMMPGQNPFGVRYPMMPPNYNEAHRDARVDNPTPPPIYDDYHQGKLPAPVQKSQDDIALHKQQRNNALDTQSLRSARSVGDLSVVDQEEHELRPTQSMGALSQNQDQFTRSKLNRSVSFRI